MSEFAYREIAVDADYPIWGRQEIPGFIVNAQSGLRLLAWHNTIIRGFPDDEFDHIEFRHQPVKEHPYGYEVGKLEKTIGAIALTGWGEELAIEMMEAGFPQRWDPIVDEATYNWYSNLGAIALDNFLKGQ